MLTQQTFDAGLVDLVKKINQLAVTAVSTVTDPSTEA